MKKSYDVAKVEKFHGAMTAIVTPMSFGEVDELGLKRLINFQIEKGIHGLVPCGTTGESATISMAEHKRIIELTVKEVNGRVPVIAGAGANNTEEAIELTRAARNSGAEAILSVVPYYNRPSQEGMYQHFRAINNAIDIPIFLYNVPSRTSVNMTPETVARLSEIPNIIGIKDATGDLKQTAEIIQSCPEDFIILSGDDFTTLPTIAIGGKGCISVASNVEPQGMSNMVQNALEGNWEEAKKEHYRLRGIMEAMFCYPSPAPAKKALELMRIISTSEVRLPMTEMEDSFLEKLITEMRNLKMLN